MSNVGTRTAVEPCTVPSLGSWEPRAYSVESVLATVFSIWEPRVTVCRPISASARLTQITERTVSTTMMSVTAPSKRHCGNAHPEPFIHIWMRRPMTKVLEVRCARSVPNEAQSTIGGFDVL